MTSKVSQKPMIPLRDKFNLSPIEKHIEYKRFPYKLIFHTFLVFLTTTQVLVMVDSEYTAHAREQFRMFKSMLLDSTEESNIVKFLTVADFQEHLQMLVDNFQNMNETIYQNYYDDEASFSIAIYYIVSGSHIFPVDFNTGVVGPLNPSDPSSVKVNHLRNNLPPHRFASIGLLLQILQNFVSQISKQLSTHLLILSRA